MEVGGHVAPAFASAGRAGECGLGLGRRERPFGCSDETANGASHGKLRSLASRGHGLARGPRGLRRRSFAASKGAPGLPLSGGEVVSLAIRGREPFNEGPQLAGEEGSATASLST